MARSPLHRLFLIAALAGLSTVGASAVALAAPPACLVKVAPNPDKAALWLQTCVAQVNAGGPLAPTEIIFEGPQVYDLFEPLELRRDVIIHGEGQVVQPGLNFPGDDGLIRVGAKCPGPQCAGPITATIEGMEITGAGNTQNSGIVLRGEHTLTLDEVFLHHLETSFSGACLKAGRESKLFIVGGQIEDCTASGEGGGLFSEASLVTMQGTEFRGNTAHRGGAVYMKNAPGSARKITIWHGVFEDNQADLGGAIMNETGFGVLNSYASTFRSNHANDRGGALFGRAGIFDSLIEDNSANHNGGGAFFDGETVIQRSTFRGNDAGYRGGGLYGGAEISDSLFENNSAGNNGGGALLETESSVSGSTFRANDAWRGGGLTTLTTGAWDFEISHSTFENNTVSPVFAGVPMGGALFIGRAVNPPPGSTTFIRNCTLSGNHSTAPNGYGGALSVAGGTAVVEHATFYGNDAWRGRAIYSSSSGSTDLTLNSSIVANGTVGTNACFLGTNYQTTTSLASDASCSVAFPSSDPMLGPLADNGGNTETHLPAASVVLDNATCFATDDQRGFARPTVDCDIGSVEQ